MKNRIARHILVCSLCCLLCAAPAIAGPRADILPGPVQGRVIDVVDGDTVTVRLHVWIGQEIETLVRINGIDTPEIHGKCATERAQAQAARDEIRSLLSDNRIKLKNVRLEKYAGRVLADAYATDGTDIRAHMIGKGFARPYGGEKRRGWCAD